MKHNETHAEKCKKLNKKYLFSYEKGDVLIDNGKEVIKSCSYLRIVCLYCEKEYDISYNNLYKKNLCRHCCNSIENSFYYRFSDLELYDEDLNKINSKYLYPNSNKSFFIKCGKCGNISNKMYQLSDINQNEYFSCKFCSDGISYPNKFMNNLLKMLDIDYEVEITRKTFEWCKNYRYDFFIPSLRLIIEMDGNLGHGRDTAFTDGEKSIKTDIEKDKLAKENGFNIVRVNCRYNCREDRFEYIKTEIIKILDNIFDFQYIDWDKINELSLESNMIKSWDMWNKNVNIKDIAKELNVSECCVRVYLNKGNDMGKCYYNGREEISKSNKKRKFGKNVKLIFPNGEIKVFHSIDSFLKFLNIGYSTFYNTLSKYDEINIGNIKSNSKMAKITKKKLKEFNGCKYIIEDKGWNNEKNS